MKLLITGANGQVGRELRRALDPLGEVIASCRDGHLQDGCPGVPLDLDQHDALRPALDRLQPDVIVNAAAYTAVDKAEENPDPARRINAGAVGVLAGWAADHGIPMVHYSTDYVFDGRQTQPWCEEDATAPLGVYGASKLAGERALQASGATHLLLRTAWVYAVQGHNFLNTMLRLGTERERLRVVDDQHGTPTSAALIADVTADVLQQWLAADDIRRARTAGTYHLVANGRTTWYGFARAIMREARALGLLDHDVTIEAIPGTAFPTPARRPAWSVLDTTRLRDTFGIVLPDWEAGLKQTLAQKARLSA